MLAALKSDPHVHELAAEIESEAAVGRMRIPISIDMLDLERSVVARRFSLEQGLKRDGSIRIRSVDDETSCGTNLCVKPADKLKRDGIDALAALASLLHSFGRREFSLWKADVKSAYRRVPVRLDQRWRLVCCHVGQ